MRLIVSSTRARVSGATLGAPFRTRDAVVFETFAARAKSRIVGSRCEFRVSGVWPTLGTFPKRMTPRARQATDKATRAIGAGASGGHGGALLAAARGRGLVEPHRLRVDDHAVVALGELQRREAVEHVREHQLRVALERVAVTAGVRDRDLQRVAGFEPSGRHLRRPALLPSGAGVADQGRVDAVLAAEDAPRRVRVVALAFAGDDRVDEEAVDAYHADAAAPLAGGARLIAQLV